MVLIASGDSKVVFRHQASATVDDPRCASRPRSPAGEWRRSAKWERMSLMIWLLAAQPWCDHLPYLALAAAPGRRLDRASAAQAASPGVDSPVNLLDAAFNTLPGCTEGMNQAVVQMTITAPGTIRRPKAGAAPAYRVRREEIKHRGQRLLSAYSEQFSA